jgi:LysM repeat protein
MHHPNSSFPRILLLLFLTMLIAAPASAQDASSSDASKHSSDASGPPLSVRSAPASVIAQPAPAVAAPRDVEESTDTSSAATASASDAKAVKAHKFFPYTVKPGDSLGTVAQFFGMPVADLARINRLHEDDDLEAGQTLKIPNPFEASNRNLTAQVEQLSEESRAAQAKIDQAQAQATSLTNSNAELSAQNATLKDLVKVLPWWRGTALAVGGAALLMLGVTALTLFEWWMLRRRFLALSDLAMSLSRLDVKYKETIAKAELRMQQLYGRRRPAGAPENLLGGMKTPDEIEVERLSHELRATLERHLEQLGVRGRRTIGARWREVLGGDEEPSPSTPPRPYRR